MRGRIARLLEGTVNGFAEDNCFLLSAAMSYYLLLSLAPILVIVVAVVDRLGVEETTLATYLESLEAFLGEDVTLFLMRTMRRLRQEGGSGWAAAASGVVLFVTATTSFVKLKEWLNVVWGTAGRRRVSVVRFVLKRLDSFVLILLIAALLFVSLLFDSGLVAVFGGSFRTAAGSSVAVFVAFTYIASIFFDGVLFLFIFKVLPDVFIRWRIALAGGLVTSILFQVSKLLIGLVLSGARVTSVYGSAGTFVLLLIWIYYAFVVFFLGAEFTKSLTRTGSFPAKL